GGRRRHVARRCEGVDDPPRTQPRFATYSASHHRESTRWRNGFEERTPRQKRQQADHPNENVAHRVWLCQDDAMPHRVDRREFLAGMTAVAIMPRMTQPKVRFSVIGVNHDHINGMTNAVIRGGGELVAVYAKEPELAAAYQKRFPQAKLARSEQEVLESDVQ